jgi:dTDP-4-amino-4,6-dideoxygalactose transaminase
MTIVTQKEASEQFIVFGAPRIEQPEIDEVVDSLESGWLGTGPKVARFEAMFRRYVGAEHALAVNSCTAGMHLSLLVAGLGSGDEVITTPMTFVSTINCILHAGATPVLVDCDRKTGLIDPQRIEDAITPRTRAILPVHLYGRPCNMDAIMAIAGRHHMIVVEDAAHAMEATYKGRKIGNIGHLTCFSFYVTKNVTTGEGGMVTTNESAFADKIKIYALHGMTKDAWKRYSDEGYKHYQVIYPGFKYNMMDIQASIGIHQLARVESWLERRNEIWRRYSEAFADLPVGLPAPDEPETVHARHLYTLLIDREHCGLSRDEFMQRLYERGIGTGVHFIGAHLQPYYRDRFGYRPEDFPNATWISDRTVSIPLSAKLTDADVGRIIEAVSNVLSPG